MIIEYDKIADSLYIYFKKEKIIKTVKMQNNLLVDIDQKGNIVGMEIVGASQQLPKKNLTEISFRMPCFN